MLSVREFALDDILPLVALMQDLGYPTTVEVMQRRMDAMSSCGEYVTFVADYHGKVVGMIGVRQALVYESDGPFVQITALVTLSEYRGAGVGSALINQAESWAKAQGATAMFLTSGIKPERADAHRFYQHIGYDITGYRFVKEI